MRKIKEKKAILQDENKKSLKLSLPYYFASVMYDFICDQLQFNVVAFGTYERNKIEILRNQLHQKLL